MSIAWGYERLRPEPPGASARQDWVPRLGGGWWSTCSKRGSHSTCRRGHLKWSIPGRCSRDPHPDGALLAGTPPRGFPIRSARPGPRSCEPGSRGPTLHSRISEGDGAGAGTSEFPAETGAAPGGGCGDPRALSIPAFPALTGKKRRKKKKMLLRGRETSCWSIVLFYDPFQSRHPNISTTTCALPKERWTRKKFLPSVSLGVFDGSRQFTEDANTVFY